MNSTSPSLAPSLFPDLPRRYHVERQLGEGSQKRVFLAEDRQLGRRVAIAMLNPRGVRRPAIDRLHEVRAMARIGDHPHIVAIYDVIEGPESIYIVSRYLPGGDLETRLDARTERALALPDAVRIASEVSLALEHAHASGICHCDVKPGNIFLDENDTAVLGDFGFAEIATAAIAGGNQILGTPAYLAPEQITRDERGPSCDLYALGCLLYELTTGRPPFVATNAADVLRLHQVARPTAPADRNRAIPPALDDLILKLLEKDPLARPASARDVRAALSGIRDLGITSGHATPALGRAADVAIATRPDPKLVARETTIAAVDVLLERARRGSPGVVLIEGEAGIGKTRVLRELRRAAEERGCLVLYGQGYRDAPIPFRPFVEALLPLAGRISELDPARAELVRDFLYLGDAALQSETPAGREARHHLLFFAVSAALATFSTPRPLVLILDDLHWADSASLDLLEYLAAALSRREGEADLELLLIGGHRPVDRDHRLSRTLQRIGDEAITHRIELARLNESGVFELMTSLGIERPSGQLVHRVHELTGGNPLFVREIVDHLVHSGTLMRQDGYAVSSHPSEALALPSTIASAIAERTSRLSEPCRELVAVASLLGVRFELDRLAAITGRSSAAQADTLAEAVSVGVLVDEGHKYRFAHPLIQQVMSQASSPEQRQALHWRIAEHLLGSGDAELATSDLEIAFHLVRAGSLVDPVQLMRQASRAADHALARYAWHEAAELLEAAIAASGAAPDISRREVAELHRNAALAYFGRYDSGPCFHHYDEAACAYQSAGDATGLAHALNDRARAAVWLGRIRYGDDSDLKPLEDALEKVGGQERGLRALILNTLAESYWAALRPVAAERAGSEALQLASAIGDHRLCAEVSINLGLIFYQSTRIEEALSIWREARAHARRAGDFFAEERCLQRSVLALLASGRIDEAERTAFEVQEMNRILQSPGESSFTSASLLSVSVIRGDLEAAQRHGEDALDQLRRAKYPWAAIMSIPALAYVRALRGDPAGARAAIGLLSEPGIAFADPRFFEPRARDLSRLVDCLRGDADWLDAADLSTHAVAEDGHDLTQIVDVCARVEFADALSSPVLAEGTSRLLGIADENGVLFLSGWPFFLPRLRGVVALLEQDWDTAVAHFERATAIAERSGARPERARSELDLARALAARNADGDRRRAREVLAHTIPELRAYLPGAALVRAEKLSAFLDGEST